MSVLCTPSFWQKDIKWPSMPKRFERNSCSRSRNWPLLSPTAPFSGALGTMRCSGSTLRPRLPLTRCGYHQPSPKLFLRRLPLLSTLLRDPPLPQVRVAVAVAVAAEEVAVVAVGHPPEVLRVPVVEVEGAIRPEGLPRVPRALVVVVVIPPDLRPIVPQCLREVLLVALRTVVETTMILSGLASLPGPSLRIRTCPAWPWKPLPPCVAPLVKLTRSSFPSLVAQATCLAGNLRFAMRWPPLVSAPLRRCV